MKSSDVLYDAHDSWGQEMTMTHLRL